MTEPEKPPHPLKAWRERHNLTLEAAGERCGISYESFRRFETGIRRPSGKAMEDICAATGLTPNDFYQTGDGPAAATDSGAALPAS